MYLVFDIGGTKMRLAVSEDGTSIARQEKVATPQNFSVALKEIVRISSDLLQGEKPSAAAGGIAGTFDHGRSTLLRAPHLKGWVGKPIKKEFEKIFGVEVELQNDAAMVGLGEALLGAGRGFSVVAYITVSTGVGGARIVNGKIDRSVFGFEPGHQIIDADGNLCPQCAKPGDLENYISGSAVEARFGKRPKDILDSKVWNELALWLSYGLLNTTVHWSPEVIVLGGSMIVGDPAIPIEHTEKKLKEIMKNFPELPKLKKAELADEGGLIGSLAYLN